MSWLESGFSRVFRGGGWRGDPQYARFAIRVYGTPDYRGGDGLSFRLLRRVS
jgi:formylglycine-generating enzyme required for sulfatase activity